VNPVSSNEPPLTIVPIAAGRPRVLAWVMKHEFLRFLVSGGIAALVNFLSAWCYRRLLKGTLLYFEISVALGYSVGTVISFVLNKFLTFRATTGRTWAQFLRFLLVAAASIGITMVVARLVLWGILLFQDGMADRQLVESIAHVVTIGVMTVFNYFVIKYVAFARAVG
jgi:putative flippase GtrA